MSDKYKLPGAKTTIKYKGGSKKAAVAMQMPRAKAEVIEKEDAPMGLINGRVPDSSYEWNMARALWAYGWDDFMYQVAVKGGHELRGGQVLDFLIPTRPAWTAVPVDGGHWHSNPTKEQLKDTELLKALRAKGYQVRNEVIHAVDKDCVTFEAAKGFVVKNFGRR